MRSCVIRWSLSLSLLMALTSCATMRHQDALYKEAERHVYAEPIEKVWPQVVSLVSAEGYPPRKGDREFILVTEWRNDVMDSRVVSSVSRVYAEGYRLDEHTSRVRIFRQSVVTGNKGAMNARSNQYPGGLTMEALNSASDNVSLMRAPVQVSRSFDRDGELEWKLLQRLDAKAAEAIEARVTGKEKK